MPDKLTDEQIKKACKDCLHYEACKGTYYSAKSDEDILYDFDGEMYANSGCEDFKDKDLINRLQAENEELHKKYDDTVLLDGNMVQQVHELLIAAKAEAYKECIEKVKEKSCKLNMCHNNIVVKTDYQISGNALNNLLKELVGDDNA